MAAQHPTIARYQENVAGSVLALSDLLTVTAPAEAEELFRAALDIRKKLAARYPSVPQYQNDLAVGQEKLAAFYARMGRPKETEAEYRAALEVRKKLVAKYPDVVEYRNDLARSLYRLGQQLYGSGRLKGAEVEYAAALSIRKGLVAECPTDTDCWETLAGNHAQLALLYVAGRRFVEAETAYSAALEIWKKLVAHHPAVGNYQFCLALMHYNLAGVFKLTGRDELAEGAQLSTQDIRKKLAWVYDRSGKQGWFRPVGNKKWIETTTEGPRREFEEMATGAYVELVDRNRNLWVRLYADHSDWRRDKDWNRLYTGRWVRAADLPKPPASP